MKLFVLGDNAVALKEITRVDGRCTVKIGERVKIVAVYNGLGCQIVNIEPYAGGYLCDIVIMHKKPSPLKLSN